MNRLYSARCRFASRSHFASRLLFASARCRIFVKCHLTNILSPHLRCYLLQASLHYHILDGETSFLFLTLVSLSTQKGAFRVLSEKRLCFYVRNSTLLSFSCQQIFSQIIVKRKKYSDFFTLTDAD